MVSEFKWLNLVISKYFIDFYCQKFSKKWIYITHYEDVVDVWDNEDVVIQGNVRIRLLTSLKEGQDEKHDESVGIHADFEDDEDSILNEKEDCQTCIQKAFRVADDRAFVFAY